MIKKPKSLGALARQPAAQIFSNTGFKPYW
jgi:hypothetical protein